MTEKYGAGLGGLPSQYTHLFNSNLDMLLSHSPSAKQKWLANIWSTRESRSRLQLHRDPEVQHNNLFLKQWRFCADPQRTISERIALQQQTLCSRRAQVALTDRQPWRSKVEPHQSSSSDSDCDRESHDGSMETSIQLFYIAHQIDTELEK